MVVLRTLTLLLGALAVLTLGALSGPASADAPMPSCHEMEHRQDAPAPDKPMKTMGCCVACVTAVAPEPPIRGGASLPSPSRIAARFLMPVGESLSPEPHPPRQIPA